ncbi:MAG TPA: peptidylprolyl isomerase [Anaerolineales bacterium]|nr:peptidylprolyl isomerase [Anaerolineales bacterium]HNQ94193.1 peptidylprolyl isomerase [Anaerolineales bacterium]HNS61242.1 peptidylprolyl isomerase [Anaerolineales bacterium]
MANKKKIDEREKALQSKQSEQTVQRVGLAVVVLVVIGLVFVFIRNRPTQPAERVTITQYAAPPEMTIDPSAKYFAAFKMQNGGEFVAELFADKTPVTVNNFVFLAREGFYNGLTFHRVIDGFMAQGGDPVGDGTGDPGYSFKDEIRNDLVFDRAGLLAMANSGPNTNGSQFFITFGPAEWLNGLHTIFGQVIEGMDVVNAITRTEPGSGTPADVIESVTITEE